MAHTTTIPYLWPWREEKVPFELIYFLPFLLETFYKIFFYIFSVYIFPDAFNFYTADTVKSAFIVWRAHCAGRCGDTKVSSLRLCPEGPRQDECKTLK